MSFDSLTLIPKQPCGFHCRIQNCSHTHTHTAAACACWEEQTAKAVPKRLCSTTRLRVPLNSMTHFSQLGLAGWQGALVHAALNNWDCKVNVRRIAKDRSNPPLPARPSACLVQSAGCTPANFTPALSSSQCWSCCFGKLKLMWMETVVWQKIRNCTAFEMKWEEQEQRSTIFLWAVASLHCWSHCKFSRSIICNSPADPTVNVMYSHPPLQVAILPLDMFLSTSLIPFIYCTASPLSLVDAVIHHSDTSGRKE